MRDLSALQVYSLEELELIKWVKVKTPDQCVQEEEHLMTIQNAIADLKENKVAYANDRQVERIVARLESCANFLRKACGSFTTVADDILRRRNEIELKRKENAERLENHQNERKRAIREANSLEDRGEPVLAASAPKKRKVGRPPKNKGGSQS